jgi:spermidine synthase
VMATVPATGAPEPLAYYHSSGALADSLFAAQELWAKAARSVAPHVGIVGLGTGSMLCHRKDGERWTNYEIDKAVVDAAANPKLFRFISECGMGDPIIIGDARLKLADEPAGTFDYLQIDAFSSDAIPAHLLTRQAFDLYFSRLAPSGMLAIHISNRYLEIASILQAIAAEGGYDARIRTSRPTPEQEMRRVHASTVVVMARNEQALARLATDQEWKPLPDLGTRAWTDDYSNLLGAFIRGLGSRE